MTARQFKAKLFEAFMRNLLFNCGFNFVQPDGLYVFENQGLFFINGKGSAHDADVLMDPPIQIPFFYPTRVLFECKAYEKQVRLPVVRNALGLRADINEFEIINKEDLLNRKNNKRKNLALENRKRFFYQVGVASLNDFTKNAIEFATNNKIPLFSMRWLAGEAFFNSFDDIDDSLISKIKNENYKKLKNLFKKRDLNFDILKSELESILGFNEQLAIVLQTFKAFIEKLYIGILETGDIIFLYPPEEGLDILTILDRNQMTAKLFYDRGRPDLWDLEFSINNKKYNYIFFLPRSIFEGWRETNYDRLEALNIKGNYFARIFIFNKYRSMTQPFYQINLDKEWFDEIRGID